MGNDTSGPSAHLRLMSTETEEDIAAEQIEQQHRQAAKPRHPAQASLHPDQTDTPLPPA
jgi:hypothetical protein